MMMNPRNILNNHAILQKLQIMEIIYLYHFQDLLIKFSLGLWRIYKLQNNKLKEEELENKLN